MEIREFVIYATEVKDGWPRGETTAAGAPITLDTTLGELNETQMTKVQDVIVRAEGTVPGITHTRDDESLPWKIRERLYA